MIEFGLGIIFLAYLIGLPLLMAFFILLVRFMASLFEFGMGAGSGGTWFELFNRPRGPSIKNLRWWYHWLKLDNYKCMKIRTGREDD